MWVLEIFFHWRWLWLTLTQRSGWLTEVRMPCSQISPVAGVWCCLLDLNGFESQTFWNEVLISQEYIVWIELLTNPHPETRLSLERLLFWRSVIQFLLRVKGLPACIAAWIHCAITVVRLLIGCLLSVFRAILLLLFCLHCVSDYWGFDVKNSSF